MWLKSNENSGCYKLLGTNSIWQVSGSFSRLGNELHFLGMQEGPTLKCQEVGVISLITHFVF